MRPTLCAILYILVIILSLQAGLQGQQIADQPSSALAVSQKVPKGETIGGKVVDADTGECLRKVTLALNGTEDPSRDEPNTTQTDANGDYRFEDVKPGGYTLSVFRNGYVSRAYAKKSLNSYSINIQDDPITFEVRPKQTPRSINIQLIRCGAVEGRILDSDKEPVAHASVLVERKTSFQGKRRLTPVGMATTDDRGHYRIFGIPPGMYYLSAYCRADKLEHGSSDFPPNYYPGVTTFQEASKIQVSSGRDLIGMDMILANAKTYSASGKIVGPDGKPIVGGGVNPVLIVSKNFLLFMAGNGTDDQGEFELKGLTPGTYCLSTIGLWERKLLAGNVTIEVSNRNLEGVVIALGGIEITGRVVMEGQSKRLHLQNLGVTLEPDIDDGRGFFIGGNLGGRIKEDSTFHLTNVSEMTGKVRISGLTGDSFLKSIRVNGRDVTAMPIEIKGNSPLEGLEIVVSSQGASLSGVVKIEEQGPPAKGATVVVFPVDLEKRDARSHFVKSTLSDQQGRYSVGGLPPGEYFLNALKPVEGGIDLDEAYLGVLQEKSIRIYLELGESRNETLIAHEAPDFE